MPGRKSIRSSTFSAQFRAIPDRFDKRRPPSYMSHSPQHPGNDRPSRSMSIVLDAGVSFAESRRM